MYKIICVSKNNIGENLLKNQQCIENSNQFLENNTLYIIYYLVNTFDKIKSIVVKNIDKNIVFKTKNKIINYILHNNPLNRILKTNGVVALYVSNRENNTYETIYIDLDIDDYIYIFLSILPKPLFKLFSKTIIFIKFTFVGITGFLVNLLTLYVSTNFYSKLLSYQYAVMYGSITSFEISLIWNFILHEYWTFRNRNLKKSPVDLIKRWFKYHIGSTSSFLSQVFFTTLLSGYFKQPLYLSLTIGVLIGLIINYIYSSRIAWKK